MGDFSNPLASLQQQGFAPPDEQQPAAAPPPQVPPIAATSSGQPIPPQSGRPGTLKSMLFNFMQGAGESMIHESGGKTPWEKQQEQIAVQQRQQQIDQAGQQIQSMIELHKAQAAQQQLTTLSPDVIAAHPELGVAAGLQGTPKSLNELVARLTASAQSKEAKENVADTNKEARLGAAATAAAGKSPTEIALRKLADEGDPQAGRILKQMFSEKKAIAETRNESRILPTVNPEGELGFETGAAAIAHGSTPAGLGTQVMAKEKVFEDIRSGSQSLRKALTDLDKEFTQSQRAKLTLAMKSPSSGVLTNAITSMLGTEQLTEKQRALVIATKQMAERSLSLRSLAMQGRGNIEQQHAVLDLLPSVVSADKKYALQQLDAFDNQTGILEKGLPKRKQSTAAPKATAGDPLGLR